MALSPNGKTIASGSGGSGYNVRLWDVETRNGIAKWTGHTRIVCALCWSADGGRVASGSWDGTARVWDVASGKNILTIETGHDWVNAVIYSPGTSKLATGGDKDVAVKIWDAETGELLHRIEQGHRRGVVSSLGCTSDGKKIIFSSGGSIMIFDSATGSWQQIAVLEGHTQTVTSISLSQNNRFLASASDDKTARLWDLDTYLQVGVTIQHKNDSLLAALSPDGKVLVTACHDKNAYIWDVHATNTTDKLDQKASQDDPGIQRTPRSSLDNKSFLEVCLVFIILLAHYNNNITG
jgi:WD40 repeat protein